MFGWTCIHLDPHVLEWNGMEFSSIPLQYTSTHVDLDEYMGIQTRPKASEQIIVLQNKIYQESFSDHLVLQKSTYAGTYMPYPRNSGCNPQKRPL